MSLLVVESPDLVGDPDVVVEQLPAAGEVVDQLAVPLQGGL